MNSPGARFRAALREEKPLQVPGAICAYHATLAKASGFKAIYLSGGGVAAGSLGLPDLGISNLDDISITIQWKSHHLIVQWITPPSHHPASYPPSSIRQPPHHHHLA